MPSTLIVYATRHGCTETCARELAGQLDGEVTLHDLKADGRPELAGHDTLLVGGSIHAGGIQKRVRVLLEERQDELLAARLGLFLCCGYEGETAQKQFAQNYPANLREHAVATGLFGGAFDFERMGFIERAIVRKVEGITESESRVDHDAIAAFAAQINDR